MELKIEYEVTAFTGSFDYWYIYKAVKEIKALGYQEDYSYFDMNRKRIVTTKKLDPKYDKHLVRVESANISMTVDYNSKNLYKFELTNFGMEEELPNLYEMPEDEKFQLSLVWNNTEYGEDYQYFDFYELEEIQTRMVWKFNGIKTTSYLNIKD